MKNTKQREQIMIKDTSGQDTQISRPINFKKTYGCLYLLWA
ncbi:hypothetical protein PSM_A1803 [Pseudoalteromonas sp. SM9913]|nr:hypothetical protein PSM_A1803 [Pseudoalteromonas sp. SM9913]